MATLIFSVLKHKQIAEKERMAESANKVVSLREDLKDCWRERNRLEKFNAELLSENRAIRKLLGERRDQP